MADSTNSHLDAADSTAYTIGGVAACCATDFATDFAEATANWSTIVKFGAANSNSAAALEKTGSVAGSADGSAAGSAAALAALVAGPPGSAAGSAALAASLAGGSAALAGGSAADSALLAGSAAALLRLPRPQRRSAS